MKFAVLIFLLAVSLPAPTRADTVTPASEPGFEYFEPAHFRTPKISPAGKSVGFIARTGKTTQLFRLDLATGKIAGIFDPGKGDIENFWWIDDTRVLIDARGKKGAVYFSLDLGTGKSLELRNLAREPIYDIRVAPGFKDSVVVVRYEASPARYGFSYTLVDVITGKEKFLSLVRGYYKHAALSATGETRSEAWMDGTTWKIRWRASEKSPWQKREGNDPLIPFYPIALYSDENQLVVMAYDQGDTSAAMRLDPATGKRTLLAQDPKLDFVELLTIPSSPYPTGALFHGVGEINAVSFDPAANTFLQRLKGALPGNNTLIVDSTADGSVRVVANWISGHPWTYYLYANGRLAFLNQQRETPKPEQLGKTRTFTYSTRDGLQEHGSIVLPAQGNGPHPLIVMAPSFVGEREDNAALYDLEVQYFASRGYAVARFSTRGQFGFGRKFAAAGNLKMGDKVTEDVEDGIRHLVTEGLVDSTRVAMDGRAYRGLFTLYAGRSASPYRALVVRDPAGTPSAEDLRFEFDRPRQLFQLYEEVGGVEAAYQLMQRFNPAKTVPGISAAVLLVGVQVPNTTDVENLLRNNKRNYVRFATEWSDRKEDWRKYDYRIARQIADFLDQHMPAAGR